MILEILHLLVPKFVRIMIIKSVTFWNLSVHPISKRIDPAQNQGYPHGFFVVVIRVHLVTPAARKMSPLTPLALTVDHPLPRVVRAGSSSGARVHKRTAR